MTKHIQHHAKTQKGAAYRVALCHGIRRSGHSVKGGDHTTKQLENIYKRTAKTKLPKR
jgi:hypothetical protein